MKPPVKPGIADHKVYSMNNENALSDPVTWQEQLTFPQRRAEVDLTIEEVLLLVGGVFFVVYGLLLSQVLTGALQYSLASTDGIFLVLVSLQVIALGKTPFGDFRRSWLLVIAGIASATLGSIAIFTPEFLTWPVSLVCGVILLVGGVRLLVQLFTSKEGAKTWLRVGGILRQLTVACAVVYVVEILVGILTLLGIVSGTVVLVPSNPAGPLVIVLLLTFGIGLFYLTWCVHKATRLYAVREATNLTRASECPDDPLSKNGFGLLREASLDLADAFSLFRGVLLIFLGFLYYGVYFGGIPFNWSGRYGLLLVLTSLGVLSAGQFLGRQHARSWWLMTIGIMFAGMGFVSCMVPGIMTGVIRLLLGVQNSTTRVLFLALERVVPTMSSSSLPAEAVTLPPLMKRLGQSSTALNIITIAFGLDALAPVLLPNLFGILRYQLLFPVLVITVGILTLYIMHINQSLP